MLQYDVAMTAIPAKLHEAFEKIRLGKVEEGTRLFDRVEGCDAIKSAALAELSYFRHDWKRGMQFLRDFLASPEDWETVRYIIGGYKESHFTLFVLCTCFLDSWKESRSYLQQIKKQYDYYKPYHQVVSLISDPENTKRRLLESRPKLKENGTVDLEALEHKAGKVVPEHRSKRIARRWREPLSFDALIHEAYVKISTTDHIAFYERYTDRLEKAESHQEAAKSYIALENEQEAKGAIRRYMRCWQFKEPYQVAPIVLFADNELWAIMSDQRFTESLLVIPHNRES